MNFASRLAALTCLTAAILIPSSAHAAVNPMTLGTSYNSQKTTLTLRVYSANATHMTVGFYTAGYGVSEALTYTLSNVGSGVWSVSVPVSALTNAGITTVYYGYRAWGPNWTYSSSWTKGSSIGFISDVDANGNRFNPNKVLVDPYARELSQDPLNTKNQNASIFLTGATNRNTDSGPYISKGIVFTPATQSTGTKPTRAQKDDVIYEVNVRGLTKQNPNIATKYQGTYYGAGQMASSLASLGITTVEFLPIQETQNDANDVTPNSDANQNYWGYETENFFSPDRHYAYNQAAGGPTTEFQAMVQSFHNAGIKVYMDVVYNHTAENGLTNSNDNTTTPLTSWRGLDNATYYELDSTNQMFYDNTGIGANYNAYNTVAQNLIIDSLSYWINTMGVDGFRFDEAPELANNCLNGAYTSAAPNCPNGGYNFGKTDANAAINRILKEFTVRPAAGGAGVDLIAEPFMASGNQAYQVGNFPAGWSEWDSVFRDSVRQAQNELGNQTIYVSQDANDFTANSAIYQATGRYPWNSINYMDIHDGMTLKDVYGCNSSNNTQGWPYGPSDGGTTSNYSWDQGGNAYDQRRAARTGLLYEMVSAGTPMMQGGDEALRTIQCNNNSYNLDSSGNWLNYSYTSDQQNFYTFTQRAIAFRLAHPALRPVNFYTTSQVVFYQPSGAVADANYFNNTNNYSIAYTVNGSSFSDNNSMYIAFNGYSGSVTFTLPTPPTGTTWYRVTDTCNYADGPNQFQTPGNETSIGGAGGTYGLCGQAMLLLIAK